MADPTNNPPVEVHRDGATSAKIWRNVNKDGNPHYSVTFQKTYTNPETQQIAESRSFWSTDILKVKQLAEKAYDSIGRMRELDKSERHQMQEPQQPNEPPLPTVGEQQGLEAQRDIAMADVEPDRAQEPAQSPTYER